MVTYTQINLIDFLNAYEENEDRVKSILFNFTCQYNKDVEEFFKYKAIQFAKQGISATHLVFTEIKNEKALVGYYTLASKYINTTTKGNKINSKMRSRINRFSKYDHEFKGYIMPVPLIAQLGKNYSNGYNELITGDELLKMACDRVKEIQYNIGGNFVYLECEDKERIKKFYSRNGFCNFGKRLLEGDEVDKMDGKYLIQMIKYL